MGYDSERFDVKHILGPIFCTFAAALKVTSATKTATSAGVTDRVKFFQNIRLLDMNVITRAAAAAGAHAASAGNYKLLLSDGTNVHASCAMGTAAGLSTSGGVSSTYRDIDAGEQIQFMRKVTGDGTVVTHAAQSAEVYLEYRHRVAQS